MKLCNEINQFLSYIENTILWTNCPEGFCKTILTIQIIILQSVSYENKMYVINKKKPAEKNFRVCKFGKNISFNFKDFVTYVCIYVFRRLWSEGTRGACHLCGSWGGYKHHPLCLRLCHRLPTRPCRCLWWKRTSRGSSGLLT